MYLGTKPADLITHKESRSFSQGRETNHLLNISPVSQSCRLCRQPEPTAKSLSALFPSQKGGEQLRTAPGETHGPEELRAHRWSLQRGTRMSENMCLCKCVSSVWGGNRASKDKDREEKGFCMGRQLCSEPFTKVNVLCPPLLLPGPASLLPLPDLL